MRRPGPRHLSAAIEEFTAAAAPDTVLARVQAVWPRVAGPAVSAEAEPTGERAGTLILSCRSAGWAHELALLAPDLVRKLNAELEPSGSGPLKDLRVRAAGAPGGAGGPSRGRRP